MKRITALAIVALAGLSLAFSIPQEPEAAPPATQKESADEQAVRAAIEDYVLAFYEAEPERLAKSLSPDLKKMGYWRGPEDAEYHGPLHMSYDQAVELATKWNADGSEGTDIDYSIRLFEVADKTACAKLTAKWGMDYFQLAKEPDGWRIHHIVWQSAPR